MATNSSTSLQSSANIETQALGSIKVVIKIAVHEHEHVQPTQPPLLPIMIRQVVKPRFHLDLFGLLLLVLVVRTNKKKTTSNSMFKWKHLKEKQKETSNKKKKRATKGIYLFWFLRTYSISKTGTSNEEQQKATNDKWKHAPKNKTNNKKHFHSFSLIFINFHSFASTLDLWRVVDIKSKESQKEQQQAMKSNKNQKKLRER